MRIAFDVMGYENPLEEALAAARKFVAEFPSEQVILVGDESKIRPLLSSPDEFPIEHASQVVKMTDDITAIRKMPDSSMAKAVMMVANGMADAVLSAGSTAAFVAASTLLIGPLKGVLRAGFLGWFPAPSKNGITMMDMGANKECKAEHLHQFALIGHVYATRVLGVERPVVKCINIGVEANKGLELHAQTHELLLADKRLNYQGFIEPRDLMVGADVAVCDGYTGNLVVKSVEGTMRTVLTELRDRYKKPLNIPGALLSLGVIRAIKKRYDYRNSASALILGLEGIAVKAHGSAERKQFGVALRLCRTCHEQQLLKHIADLVASAPIPNDK